MTLQEQTERAAAEYSQLYPMPMAEDAACGFVAGTEWERQRDKWISAKEQGPDRVAILAATGGLILTLNYIEGEYYYGANKWCSEVIYWMPLPAFPESPKQKED